MTAFVLAGGRSSRMGSDKALLPYREQTLLQHALSLTSTVVSETYIVGARERYSGFGRVIEDIYPGCGPLGGIHAALHATHTDRNLILSVDMPLMSAAFLRWLWKFASCRPELIVVPRTSGLPQPLCAVYDRAVVDAARRALQAGEYKVGRLFAEVPTRMVEEQAILDAGFSPEIFRNLNTPEDYAQCQL